MLEDGCTSSPGRLSTIGIVLAVTFFVASFALIPVRVSFGAGSVRCGTALNPDRDGEPSRLAEACPEAGHERLREATVGAVGLLVIGLLPLALRSWTERRLPRRLMAGALLVSWAIGIPLALLFVTGAYSAG